MRARLEPAVGFGPTCAASGSSNVSTACGLWTITSSISASDIPRERIRGTMLCSQPCSSAPTPRQPSRRTQGQRVRRRGGWGLCGPQGCSGTRARPSARACARCRCPATPAPTHTAETDEKLRRARRNKGGTRVAGGHLLAPALSDEPLDRCHPPGIVQQVYLWVVGICKGATVRALVRRSVRKRANKCSSVG